MRDFIQEMLRALAAAQHPMFAQLQREPVEVLPHVTMTTPQGRLVASRQIATRSEFTVPMDEIIDGTRDGFVASLSTGASLYLEAFMKQFYEHISATSDQVGTSVDAGGQPFTWDLYLEALEKMDLAFMNDGTPVLPTLHIPEGMELPPMTPEIEGKVNDVVRRKRGAFLASRRRRQLPRRNH